MGWEAGRPWEAEEPPRHSAGGNRGLTRDLVLQLETAT